MCVRFQALKRRKKSCESVIQKWSQVKWQKSQSGLDGVQELKKKKLSIGKWGFIETPSLNPRVWKCERKRWQDFLIAVLDFKKKSWQFVP